MSPRRPTAKLPLVRNLSRPLTGVLASSRVSPNQVTVLGIGFGLAAAYLYWHGGYGWTVTGAIMFTANYVLDNCDGELARLRGAETTLGRHLDDFGDWLVHAAFFIALGAAHSRETGDVVWTWFGISAAVGGTVNALILAFAGRVEADDEIAALDELPPGSSLVEVAAFGLRGLAKADFWAIVLTLTILDWVWALLPAAGIGAHVFWLLSLKRTVRRIHT